MTISLANRYFRLLPHLAEGRIRICLLNQAMEQTRSDARAGTPAEGASGLKSDSLTVHKFTPWRWTRRGLSAQTPLASFHASAHRAWQSTPNVPCLSAPRASEVARNKRLVQPRPRLPNWPCRDVLQRRERVCCGSCFLPARKRVLKGGVAPRMRRCPENVFSCLRY